MNVCVSSKPSLVLYRQDHTELLDQPHGFIHTKSLFKDYLVIFKGDLKVFTQDFIIGILWVKKQCRGQ